MEKKPYENPEIDEVNPEMLDELSNGKGDDENG